jgi:nucleoside-diphosphate-sugar epimerase
MKRKSVSILGIGWLGEALLKELHEKEYHVRGSKSTQEGADKLSKKYNEVCYLKIEDDKITGSGFMRFFASDILIVNISPGRTEDDTKKLPGKITQLIKEINKSSVKHVIFISSTSVYPDLNQIVTEDDQQKPEKPSGFALRISEDLLLREKKFTTTVIRFGGLIGYDRVPGKFLAGKTNIPNGDAVVNLIHRDDCIGIISYFIQHPSQGEIFNAVAPVHPKRKEYYTKAALEAGLEPPIFEKSKKQKWKIVSTEKLTSKTGFEFKYPDPAKIN